jgi:hypothetical protein
LHCTIAGNGKEMATTTPERYRPHNPESLRLYVASVPALTQRLGGEPGAWTIEEVGDGNLNLVFKVRGPAGARRFGGVLYGALLNTGYTGRDADHDLGLDEAEAADDAADEIAEHGLCGFEISNHAVFKWPDGYDALSVAPDDVSSVMPYGYYLVGILIDGYNRRFIEDHTFTAYINQCISGP